MLSNGADTNPLRDIAIAAAKTISHMFTYELGTPVVFEMWDYRLDSPTVVPAGELATRSLLMVEKHDCLLGILGPTVPDITAQEISHAIELERAGGQRQCWVFVDPTQRSPAHLAFFESIKQRFGKELVYAPYEDHLQFQAQVMKTLFAHVLKQLDRRPAQAIAEVPR